MDYRVEKRESVDDGFLESFVNVPNLISMGRLISGPVLGWYVFFFSFDNLRSVWLMGNLSISYEGFFSSVKNLSFLYLLVKMLVWVDEEMGRFF